MVTARVPGRDLWCPKACKLAFNIVQTCIGGIIGVCGRGASLPVQICAFCFAVFCQRLAARLDELTQATLALTFVFLALVASVGRFQIVLKSLVVTALHTRIVSTQLCASN